MRVLVLGSVSICRSLRDTAKYGIKILQQLCELFYSVNQENKPIYIYT